MVKTFDDWIHAVEISVSVENAPVSADPTKETPIFQFGRYTGTDQTYQDVASWTVSSGRLGVLEHINFFSNNTAYTHYKILKDSTEIATDILIQSDFIPVWEDLKVAESVVIKVQAKSTDGTSITTDVIIVGKELG